MTRKGKGEGTREEGSTQGKKMRGDQMKAFAKLSEERHESREWGLPEETAKVRR